MEAMIIYLIRHGQTKWNNEGRFQGNMDIELDPTGIHQAERAGEQLQNRRIAAIYCSDLKRALHTAQIINNFAKAPLFPLPELRELRYGTWEGKKRQEVEAENAAFIRDWLKDRLNIPAPGGESFHDLGKRLEKVMTILSNLTLDPVALVTHEGVLKALICLFLDISLLKQSHFSFQNGSISTVEFDPVRRSYQIHRLNECTHLEMV